MSGLSSDASSPGPARLALLQLGALADAADALEGVRRTDLAPGDRLLVSTKNSIYSLVARADGRFEVSGGRYARDSGATGGERTLAVLGCTFGGRAIFTAIVAAPRLFLELEDGTRTTRIRRVRRIPAAASERGRQGPGDSC